MGGGRRRPSVGTEEVGGLPVGMNELTLEGASLVLEGVLPFISGLRPTSSVLSCKEPELSLTGKCSSSPDFRPEIQGEKVRAFPGHQLRENFKGGTEIPLPVSGHREPCPSVNQTPVAGLVRALG